jgi:hypothetical protein
LANRGETLSTAGLIRTPKKQNMKPPEEVLLRVFVVVVVVTSLLANFVRISSTMKPSSIVTTLLCGALYQSD